MGAPNYERIRRWDADLRSGKFTQATYRLRDQDTNARCCLGVYCQQYVDEGLASWDDEALALTPELQKELGAEGTQISGTLEWLGLRDLEGNSPWLRVPERLWEKARCLVDHPLRSATVLNDVLGFTFVEIADCVRETWPKAFQVPDES